MSIGDLGKRGEKRMTDNVIVCNEGEEAGHQIEQDRHLTNL